VEPRNRQRPCPWVYVGAIALGEIFASCRGPTRAAAQLSGSKLATSECGLVRVLLCHQWPRDTRRIARVIKVHIGRYFAFVGSLLLAVLIIARLATTDGFNSERCQREDGQADNCSKIRSQVARANSFRHECSDHRLTDAAARCGCASHQIPTRRFCLAERTSAGNFEDPVAG